MSNSSKIFIAILSFIICVLIGYWGMSFLRNARNKSAIGSFPYSQSQSSSMGKRTGGAAKSAGFPSSSNAARSINEPSAQVPETIPGNTSSAQTSPETGQTPGTKLEAEQPTLPEILSVSDPEYNEAGKTYSFQIVASGESLTYTVADAKKRDLQSNKTGDFTVQPSATGKYYVYITDSFGNKSDYVEVKGCYRLVEKVTKDELESIFNSGKSQDAIDADFANRISSGCRYEFVGINEDETPPGSYNEIINRIRMKTWSSVTILSVSHNSETNKLVRAKIQVNY